MQTSAMFVKKCLTIKTKNNRWQEYSKDKKYCKVKVIVFMQVDIEGAAHKICNVIYSILKEIPVVFHNGSNFDYYFIINELADFKGQFIFLERNT